MAQVALLTSEISSALRFQQTCTQATTEVAGTILFYVHGELCPHSYAIWLYTVSRAN